MPAYETEILELRRLSKERLEDAKVLLNSDRKEGARYICGYAVECILKYKVCRVLCWQTYPPQITTKSGSPLDRFFKAVKTHDLEVLLLLTGQHGKILNNPDLSTAWNDIKDWDSEIRYQIQPVSKSEIQAMIESAKILLKYFGVRNV